MARKKNILNDFFNMNENEELNLSEEELYDEELSNILEKEVEKPKVEEIIVKNKYTIVDEPIVEEKKINLTPVVDKKVDELKPERNLPERMKRRLGIK